MPQCGDEKIPQESQCTAVVFDDECCIIYQYFYELLKVLIMHVLIKEWSSIHLICSVDMHLVYLDCLEEAFLETCR